MSGLVYDEQSLVDGQVYKYDKYLHSRINKYTGAGRIMVKYWNINDSNTSTSKGFNTHYQIIGNDSPLRYDEISNMILLGLSPLQPEEKQLSNTSVRNYSLSGEAYVIPGTIMPKENDFFIINHINMNHLFRVIQVTQDGLNTDGSYKINYELFSTNPQEIVKINDQTINHYIMDPQTIGGEDLTPIISTEDHELRSRLISMVDDMIENYISRYYDNIHNCFLLHLNGRTLFDVCGNMFMSKHGVMINDNKNGNIVLNSNKIRDQRLDWFYQKSPYKWIERDAPTRYIDSFKYRIISSWSYPDSSFAKYGYDIDVMVPTDSWCDSLECKQYFPNEAVSIFENDIDIRECTCDNCRCCEKNHCCYNRHYKRQRFDYVSIIHDFIHGKLTNIHTLSLYIGDQLFDNAEWEEIYLWTPIIIYIIKQVLKIK